MIYAESWYLDIVTKQDWGVLVLGDYDAVMPIPYARMKRRFWKKSIVQPFFCQQLGIFAEQDISQELYDAFYDALREMQPLVYQFNHENNAFLQQRSGLTERQNYVLVMNKSYTEIQKSYATNLKRNIKKAVKNKLIFKEISEPNDFINLKKNNSKHLHSSSYEILKKLIIALKQRGRAQVFGVYSTENELLAASLILNHKKKLYYSVSASSQQGKDVGASPFLIDSLIGEKIDAYDFLDFEGSSIPSIARFFQQFGAVNQPYTIFES